MQPGLSGATRRRPIPNAHILTGAAALYTPYESPSDPRFSDAHTFTGILSKLFQARRPVVGLDWHTSRAGRPSVVDFGS